MYMYQEWFLFWQARASLIDKQYEADREKLHKIRLLLVRIFKSHFLKKILVDFGGFYCLVDPPTCLSTCQTMLITFFSLSWCPFSNMCLHVLFSYINFPNLKTFNFYLTWVFACITFYLIKLGRTLNPYINAFRQGRLGK